MSEIREYRGKRLDTGEWVYGGCYQEPIDEIKDGKTFIIGGALYNVGSAYPVDPETVGQYTGLPDKNGTKIFDGDVVEVLYRNIGVIKKGKVVFEDFGWFCATDYLDYVARHCDIKVIGNIHDNLELLEVWE